VYWNILVALGHDDPEADLDVSIEIRITPAHLPLVEELLRQST
jgi:hypothetical protein